MAIKTWRAHPLHVAIMEILERRGPLTDTELYDLLRADHEDIGFGTLNQTLMRMEIEGKIYVSTLAKGKRRIELVKIREG
ncbi:MAG: hypothetical protein AOA65_0618 [Candidatus Bathyarchaeota archaeon BA1]|nr:MAG: hypothetical protein AOA65_0618 [Candidatus Bathyarchaeota archaeon BA1]